MQIEKAKSTEHPKKPMDDKTSKDAAYIYILFEAINAVTLWEHSAHYS